MKIILLTLLSFNVMAISCPKDRVLKDIVLDMVKLDLSGIRIDGLQNGSCVKETDHPYALVVHDSSNEESSTPNFFVEDMNSIKVLEINIKDKETFSYEAIIQFEGIDKKNVKTTIKDKYLFLLNKDAEVQRKHGCFSVLDYPENILVFKKCMK